MNGEWVGDITAGRHYAGDGCGAQDEQGAGAAGTSTVVAATAPAGGAGSRNEDVARWLAASAEFGGTDAEAHGGDSLPAREQGHEGGPGPGWVVVATAPGEEVVAQWP